LLALVALIVALIVALSYTKNRTRELLETMQNEKKKKTCYVDVGNYLHKESEACNVSWSWQGAQQLWQPSGCVEHHDVK